MNRRPIGDQNIDLTVFEDLGDGRVIRFAGFSGHDWSAAGGEFVEVAAR